jgi:hypothetical protein
LDSIPTNPNSKRSRRRSTSRDRNRAPVNAKALKLLNLERRGTLSS